MLDLLWGLSWLFEDHLLLTTLVLLAIAFFKLKRRTALVIALALALLFTYTIKDVYQEQRPCFGESFCPDAGMQGFPSGHTAVAFIFIMASIGSAWFVFYLPLGLFMMASRVWIGVHSITQVAGGAVLGILFYAIGLWVYEKIPEWLLE